MIYPLVNKTPEILPSATYLTATNAASLIMFVLSIPKPRLKALILSK